MSHNAAIKLLPEHLIDQIKAGEVVERPAALLKEIIENSLDAGAKNLDLQLIDNGLELVALEDDGHGMSYDDLPYAFARHATSKIFDYADLFKLASFGFRGEALASIASVSRLTCTSAKASGAGGKIEIHGAEMVSHTEAEGMRPGTSLFIRDLFYNTPARLKFVKSKTSEKNALKRVLDAFLLTARKSAFSIRWDQQDKSIFAACPDHASFLQRLERIFFKRKDSGKHQLYEIVRDFEGHRLELHISARPISGQSKQQFLFANDRLFNEKRLHQTITRGLPNLWGNESGHYACFFTVPAQKIDVNVHPNKTEIKFAREDIIFALIKAALKDLDSLAVVTDVTPQTQQDWRRYENEVSSDRPMLAQEVTASQLPVGYRWHPEAQNTIIDESALIRFLCQRPHTDAQLEFVPLLINEPISWQNAGVDLNLLNQLGFDLEWIDHNLLALRAVSQWLRALPYTSLCRHALTHLTRSSDQIYDDFIVTSHLPPAMLVRLLSDFSLEKLKYERIAKELDVTTLTRLFAK